ncbi:hypothetical protein LX36DRAFT_677274 [Colletotrichum falcatum]|nr:hypothetical protein LX36DRAFT_677274 [Colletotrichum falcatum]
MPFQHAPLENANSVRLFVLHNGNFDDELTGSLYNGPLHRDGLTYNFLSYAWKDASEADASLPLAKSDQDWDRQDNSRTIRINGQPFKIAHNLALALLHIRSRKYTQTLRSQIYLMSTIVSKAQAVISWLGPDDPQQFSTKRSDKNVWSRMKLIWNHGKTKSLPYYLQRLKDEKLDTTRAIPPALLERIGQRPYWTRIWVLVELCYARRVLFVSGTNVWRERDFYSCLHSFGTLPVVKTLNARRDRDRTLPFATLLIKYHSYESENPLDKLYALAALSSEEYATAKNRRQFAEMDTRLSDLTMDLVRCTVQGINPTTLVESAQDLERTYVVLFAALAQKALGSRPTPLLVSFSDCIVAKGYIAGYVHHVGRSYRDIAASPRPRASGDYTPLYQDEQDNAIFRAFAQDYTTKAIMSRRLEQPTTLCNGFCFSDQTRGWAFREGTLTPTRALLRACYIAAKREGLPAMQTGGLVQFIGNGGNVGFAYSEAGVEWGDRIIAFHGCHVGLIARSLPGSSCLQIISTADVETAPRTKRAKEELGGPGARERIVSGEEGRPFPLAAQGNVQRAAVLGLYKKKIEELYEQARDG